MLFNLRCKSLISSDSQTLTEILFIVQLSTTILHKISHRENNVVEFTSRELNAISIKLCLVSELFVVKVFYEWFFDDTFTSRFGETEA